MKFIPYILFVMFITIFTYYYLQPVVFMTQEGEVCGCMVDEDIPSLDQCDKFDHTAPGVDTIWVSTCK